MEKKLVEWMKGMKKGKEYDKEDIENEKKSIGRMEVLREMKLEEEEKIEKDGSMKIKINVKERKKRRFGLGDEY